MKITILYSMFFFSLFSSCKSVQTTPTEKSLGYLEESQLFEFYSHFWLNLHHFLYNKASAYTEKTLVEIIPDSIWTQLEAAEKVLFEAAVIYYRDSLISEDLRRGDYLSTFKHWVVQQAENEVLPTTNKRSDHNSLLNETAAIYRKYWWKQHLKVNREVLASNLVLISKLEVPVKERLTQLVKADWQSEKIRVDICYYVKLGRPYTTTRPTHIVMNSKRNANPPGNWFELLIHEASHHFIFSSSGFIGETINQAETELNIKAPRGLWHGYLFYFSGRVCQEALITEGLTDYELYMVRRKVFAWFYPLLEQNLPVFIEGKQSLLDCTKKIILDFDKTKNN